MVEVAKEVTKTMMKLRMGRSFFVWGNIPISGAAASDRESQWQTQALPACVDRGRQIKNN
jgi:hypothetical protein